MQAPVLVASEDNLPTSQENTLKDSLGQSNSHKMANYFQKAAKQMSFET